MVIIRHLVVQLLLTFLTGKPCSLSEKGKIGGVKCKGSYGCTAIKVMYEQWNGAHSELFKCGTDAKVIHLVSIITLTVM